MVVKPKIFSGVTIISNFLKNGVAFWKEDDPGGDAEEEPASIEQGDERLGAREDQNGTAREENH